VPPAPAGADSIAVDLNLPAYRLAVWAGDSLIDQFTVAIGARRYPTPIGEFALKRVELNPGWIPPASDWARDQSPMPPGPRNPMGRAKLEFHPTYYLHGTPAPESVGSAASHGCVRLRNDDVLALAEHLLRWGRPQDADSAAGWVMHPTMRRRLPLDRGAGLTIRYDLLEIRSDRIYVWPDPYRLRSDSTDARAQADLAAALGTHQIPERLAARLLDAARDQPLDISVDSVMRGLIADPAAED